MIWVRVRVRVRIMVRVATSVTECITRAAEQRRVRAVKEGRYSSKASERQRTTQFCQRRETEQQGK
jgi:hypothetical protein